MVEAIVEGVGQFAAGEFAPLNRKGLRNGSSAVREHGENHHRADGISRAGDAPHHERLDRVVRDDNESGCGDG